MTTFPQKPWHLLTENDKSYLCDAVGNKLALILDYAVADHILKQLSIEDLRELADELEEKVDLLEYEVAVLEAENSALEQKIENYK